jgi:hypothetical protein
MCEVLSPNGEPHSTNTRAPLAALIDDKVKAEAPLFGFEQEYTMLSKNSANVIGWPEGGYPAPQVRSFDKEFSGLLFHSCSCHSRNCGYGLLGSFGSLLQIASLDQSLGAA